MDALHAPWRIQYILSPKPPASDVSLFTRIAQSSDDVGNHVIARDRSCFAMLNAYPYNGGHLMVVPYKQVADLPDLTDDELTDLMRLTRRCEMGLRQVMKPDGFNIGLNLGRVAGAGIAEHLHLHIVPRWNGDTNFMPVIGATAVVPQALTELAAQLRAALSSIA
ncbi:MAG: HIT domain-containing protein [Verrucomicrobia bacterium]|nr:HIT domain-containing protein [Verrucomicrobiota bacterium]MBI3869873.1 HIT domain-containing protein [Verrucomicrobiota bacterium]